MADSGQLAEGFALPGALARPRHVAPATFLALAGLLVCGVAVSVVAATVPSDQAFGRALVELLIVGTPIAAGLYVLRIGANTRFAFALIWIGFAWSVTSLTEASQSIPYTIGRISTWLILPSAIYLLLTFPDGRLARGFDRAVFLGFVGVSAFLFVGTAPLVQQFPPKTLWTTCTTNCPANAVFILDHQPAFLTQLVYAREWVIELLWLGVCWSMARRWRAASPLQRRVIAPAFVAGGLLGTFQIAHITYRQLGGSTNTVVALSSAWTLSIAALCATFPLGFLWHQRGLGRTLANLGPALRASDAPVKVRYALGQALGDPSLVMLFQERESARWRDASGGLRNWPQPLPVGRAATVIDGEGGAENVVLIHDIALQDDEQLLDGVAGIVVAVRRHQQLASALEDAMNSLESSRRSVEVAVEERARIERNLHDGAQQRLVALRINLGEAAKRVQTDPAGARAELGDLGLELELAMTELRALAHGEHPQVLAADGIAASLAELSLALPRALPVHISESRLARHPMEVESAVYFTCVEAMQNVTKHAAGATGIWVDLRESSETLHFEVRDDGPGMPADAPLGKGLHNMQYRIEAIGGHLEIESHPGHGTRVIASIPLKVC